MCCKSFWKRSISFFSAFCLGILVVNFFVIDEKSEKPIISPYNEKLYSSSEITHLSNSSERKKCIPVKTNLMEQKELYFPDELSIIKMIDKRAELEDQLENNKNLTIEEEKIRKDIEIIKKKVDAFLNKPKTKIMSG